MKFGACTVSLKNILFPMNQLRFLLLYHDNICRCSQIHNRNYSIYSFNFIEQNFFLWNFNFTLSIMTEFYFNRIGTRQHRKHMSQNELHNKLTPKKSRVENDSSHHVPGWFKQQPTTRTWKKQTPTTPPTPDHNNRSTPMCRRRRSFVSDSPVPHRCSVSPTVQLIINVSDHRI